MTILSHSSNGKWVKVVLSQGEKQYRAPTGLLHIFSVLEGVSSNMFAEASIMEKLLMTTTAHGSSDVFPVSCNKSFIQGLRSLEHQLILFPWILNVSIGSLRKRGDSRKSKINFSLGTSRD